MKKGKMVTSAVPSNRRTITNGAEGGEKKKKWGKKKGAKTRTTSVLVTEGKPALKN